VLRVQHYVLATQHIARKTLRLGIGSLDVGIQDAVHVDEEKWALDAHPAIVRVLHVVRTLSPQAVSGRTIAASRDG
jgi:hypothetical protein